MPNTRLKGFALKICFLTVLKLLAGAYFLLTSIYCLLAYLPYTYADVIVSPPYAWMPWFARWNAWLFWPVFLSLAATCWNGRTNRWYYSLFGALAMFGVFITVKPFMPYVQDDNVTFLWSLAALLPLSAATIVAILSDALWKQRDETAGVLFEYGTGLKAGISMALLYALSAMYGKYATTNDFSLLASVYEPSAHDSELVVWSLISHIAIVLIVLSVLNLIRMAAARSSVARALRLALLGPLMVIFVAWGLVIFFANSLSFVGWQAHFYAICFALTFTLFAIFVGSPFLTLTRAVLARKNRRVLLGALCAAMAVIAFLFPEIVGGSDWNGMFQTTFTLALWLVVAISFYAFRPKRSTYSVATVLGVLIFTIFGYQALQASEIFWGRPLGLTDDSITRSFDLYASRDASFDLAYHLLGGGQTEICGDLCRIMRQYANIRKPIVKNDVDLVSKFVPNSGPRPNIFIFVIDSVRSDYIGAYNPKVDFTPNIDKLAKDSIPIQNTYTQYAGTSLSEPAIWAGSMILHSHYQQPFHKIDGLEKLVEGDNYQMIVSWDVILRQILSPPSDIIKLDTDKPLWNNMEACSTVQQLETTLDHRKDTSRPVFFYAQPENVHQFGKNNLPKRTSENWRFREGFNNRIAYELNQVDGCLGGFFHYLQAKNLYDNSIIIVTADHGDATGELGRTSHSIIIFPEVMRVPLIVHLPAEMRKKVVYDNSRISTLTDITPSLYYLLDHRPVIANPMFGRPLFMQTKEELQSYKRNDVFFASDARAVFGLLEDHGRYFYATYDTPAMSMLFDLQNDPKGVHNIINESLKKEYDREVIEHLHAIGDFYGYKPGVGSLLASAP